MIAKRKFEAIARLKDETLADLGGWSEAELRHKPTPTEWCALEIVDHLARTDAGITAQMQANSAAPLPLNAVNKVAGATFNRMFRSSIRVKTPPSASAILPVCPPDLAAGAAKWNDAVARLQDFLMQLETEPRGGVFRHPVAGPMSLPTTLDFIETHTRHHLHQLARVRSSARSVAG